LKSRSNPFLAVALVLASAATLQAQLYWNANSGSPDYSGTWDDLTNNWNTETAGTGTQTTWATGDDAEFDVNETYTVTIDTAQTATNLNIKAGAVTFSGTNTASSNNLTVDSGASLTSESNRFLKAGTTTLTVNGTLNQTAAVSASNQRVSLAGGTGSIVFSGGFRTSGNFEFAGDISGTGSILTDAGGTFTLSGNNTYAGDTLIRSGNAVRVGSATALSPNSLLRFGANTNIIELTGADFSRTVGSSAGNVRFHAAADGAGSSGFAAVNADRTVALNGTVLWGSTTFNPATLHLGTAASTHKVTLTTDIDLNAGNRTIGSANGSAEIEGEVSGVITGAAGSILTKTGTGVLLLSNANTHPGGTVIAGSQGNVNPLRISNADALGTGSLTIGSGGNNDRARLELTGGITVPNSIPALTTRNNDFPNIVNISGNNTISSNISAGGGGSRTTFESAAGTLVMGGSVSVRQLNLFGAGDGEILGNVTNAATYSLNKAGTGKWTIVGNMSNGTGTTIAEGTLQIGNGGSTGSLGVAPVTNNGTLVINRDGDLTVPGAISGTGAIINRGPGTVTLGATLTHTGNTSIENGTLLINGDASAATGPITIGDGIGDAASATLGGIGFVGANATLASDGAIAPGGNTVNTFDILGNVSGTGSILIQVDETESDLLVVDGTLDITSLSLNLSTVATPTAPTYIIIDGDSPITGAAFASVTGLPSGYTLEYNYDDGSDSNNIALVSIGGTPFTTWATANGLSGPDAAADADPDLDGLDNLIEFVLGTQPNPANPNASSTQLAPTITVDETNLTFTFRRTTLSGTQPGLTVTAEYGSNLTAWTPAVDGTDGVAITTTTDGFGTGVDRVEVTVPKSLALDDLLFVRLKATLP
jgi:autotransporter-associated beta strand protein